MTNPLHLPWYYLLLYLVVLTLLLWLFDNHRIIKSKTLRYLVVTFVFSFIFWLIYDLFLAPK